MTPVATQAGLLTDEELGQATALRRRYKNDPVAFFVERLGVPRKWIWPKMVQVAEGIRDHQFVAVPAGHSVSKTHNMGHNIIPWFKTCFRPSTVITTAPSDNQVRNQLWREIHAGCVGARRPLGGEFDVGHASGRCDFGSVPAGGAGLVDA